MYNQTDLRAAAARLLYSDNRDTADYDMLIKFIDDSFQTKLTVENFFLDDANVEELRKKLREAPPIIIANHEEPSVVFVQNNWIPVTDRLPDKEFWEHQKLFEDDDLEVQVMIKGAKRPTTLLYNAEGEFYAPDGYGGTFYLVTHWAPLMEPPKED